MRHDTGTGLPGPRRRHPHAPTTPVRETDCLRLAVARSELRWKQDAMVNGLQTLPVVR